MHFHLIHLVFNMLWFVVLGREIEKYMSRSQLCILMFIIAGFSNTAQYLVSGANFIGASGIVMGFAAFIWIRQKKAPWEGYNIDTTNFYILLGYVVVVLALDLLSAFSAMTTFTQSIANTAHISGGIAGWLLGQTQFFRKHT